MSFEEFHEMAMSQYDVGGDIVAEYDEADFEEFVATLDHAITAEDVNELCKFFYECEQITNVRPNHK